MNAIADVAPGRLGALGNPFRILADRRTWGSLLYLLVSFPLGLAYFVFLAVGVSLGVGLMVIAVGAAVLFFVVLAVWMLTLFERQAAIHLLGADVPTAHTENWPDYGWPWVRSVFTNPVTWKGMLFLGLKFPLGLASWVATVVVLAIVGALIAAPVTLALGGDVNIFTWQVDHMIEAIGLSVLGIALVLPTAYFVSGLGGVWARLAELLLGQAESHSAPPTD